MKKNAYAKLQPIEYPLTEYDLGWLVGFLEGEGSFSVEKFASQHGRYGYSNPVASATSTDLDVLERASKLLGGHGKIYSAKVKDPTKHKPKWQLRIRGQASISLMKLLCPLMGQRRSGRIDEIVKEFPLYK